MQHLNRSNSLFGTLKSIVSSSIPWLGSFNESMDLQGKRKAARVETDEPEDAGEHRIKRKRVHSPEPEPQQRDVVVQARINHVYQPQPQRPHLPYLDPPVEVFQRQAPVAQRPIRSHTRATSLAAPDRPFHRGAHGRRTESPGPSGPYGLSNGITRTQSMDPPPRRRSAFEPAAVPQPLTRDVSMEGFRDKSRSPSSRPFRMRTSMTPQPAGQAFGPAPGRRERDSSEPPPLALLIENPVFVKAPSQPPPDRQDAERQPSMTLGTVAKAQRTARPLKRSRSSLMLDDTSMTDVSNNGPAHPINPAEKALRELEVYKTPLLPTRLQGSVNVPDMFQTHSKKARAPLLMHDRERKPRLGMLDKTKERKAEGQESPGVKPYAGRGGMKKLLARRRMEEEEAHHQARLTRLSVIEEVEEEREEETRVEESIPEPEPESEERRPTIIGGREQSSLRVGRTRNNRNHIVRPQMKPKGKAGRYAAIFDDEDEDSMVMDEESERERKMLEEAAKNAPVFRPPPSFTFAKDTPAPPIHQDARAKEPPIAALPFSLSKPSTSTPSMSSRTSSMSSSMSVDKLSTPMLQPPFAQQAPTIAPSVTVEAAVIKTVPDVTLVPPTPPPQPAELQLAETISQKSTAAIPNFFANSAIFSKPTASVSTQTTFSLVPPSTSPSVPQLTAEKKEEKTVQPATPSFFNLGKTPETEKENTPITPALPGAPTNVTTRVVEAEKPSVIASGTVTSTVGSSAMFGKEVKSAFPTASAALSSSAAPFGAPAAGTPAFSFGAPVKPAEQPATPSSSSFTFGAPAKPAEQATPALAASAFLFGAPAKPAEPATPATAPFSFNAPKTERAPADTKPAEPSASSSAPLSIFGAASKPFSFGTPAPAGTSTPTPEQPKTAFAFGQPAVQPAAAPAPSVAAAAPAPTIEAPKPLFGGTTGFAFGQSSAASASNATAEPPKPQSPFAFGTLATATTSDKKPFAFGTPSPAPPSTPVSGTGGSLLFGGTSGTTNATDAATKPFAFGAPSTPAAPRPLTPPKNGDSSMAMDESPLRGNGMDINGGKTEAPKVNGFAFGAPSASSPFGQPAANSAAPFAFGSGASGASPFGAKPTEVKPAEKPTVAFGGFGQTSNSTTFNFGQKASEPAAPSSSTGFSFGPKAPETANASGTGFAFGLPATPTAPAAPFGFGAPQLSRSSSFGQPTSAVSTPVSPFGQTAPSTGFGFGGTPTSATAPSNPFAFNGSQPASPATGNSGLPAQPATTGFSFGATNTTSAAGTTSSPFGAATPLPATGSPAFTMGAAPASSSAARPIKKMPNRRSKR